MKNPFKGIGKKVKDFTDKFRSKKPESARAIVDGVGDSTIIGGLALLGTAAFMPAATTTVLVAGGVFIGVGATAKFIASKMKPGPYDVTGTPADKLPPMDEDSASGLKAKPAGPDFSKSAKPREGKIIRKDKLPPAPPLKPGPGI